MKYNSYLPIAIAAIRGSAEYPCLRGTVHFQQTQLGVLVSAEVFGLPHGEGECKGGVFGFHIHSGDSCSGNAEDPFADAGVHYDTGSCPHPYHAGDLPPLFENRGYAYMSVLIDRFRVREIIGKTVIIHSQADDFTSQPSGNAGEKIACGRIVIPYSLR